MVDASLNKKNDDNVKVETNRDISMFTQARHVVSPYLPPPVLNVMKSIDSNPSIKSMIGDEPSMAIVTALLTIFFIGRSIKFVSFVSSGKAVEGLDDDDDAPEGQVLSELEGSKNDKGGSYDDSIILFGPSYAGKTCLFHTLLSQKKKDGGGKIPSTVMSLKADVSVLPKGELNDSKSEDCIRLVDYPGHITLSSHLPSLLHPASKSGGEVRGLLVVDSSKSVSDAASLFYNTVLTNGSLLKAWEKKNETFHIMVVCNKVDASNAKNWRRIKIQLRSELDRLKKISASVSNAGAAMLEGNSPNEEEKRQLIGKSIDLDDLSKNGLPNVKMSFLSFSCMTRDGMEALNAFVTSGEVITDNSSVLSRRKR